MIYTLLVFIIFGSGTKMSKAASPTRFAGDMDHFYDPTFTQEISQKMRVPKRIKVDGETEDDVTTNNLPPSSWHQPEKIDMHVPDRILVIDNIYMDMETAPNMGFSGQDRHFGTRAAPREMQLENSVMPPDPEVVRVQTPPRVIKLDEYSFPRADEEEYMRAPPSEPQNTIVKRNQVARLENIDEARSAKIQLAANRDFVPNSVEGMSTSEEVVHLRRQLSKLNRRVMAMELHALQQQQREKMMYAVVTAYFVIKGLLWLNRS